MIYLDNAATTFPKPPSVWQEMEKAMRSFGANPGRSGHSLSMKAAEAVFGCRQTISRLFGSDYPEGVAFTLNGTYAINLVLKGLLRSGDHVVCSDLEHNAVMRPLYALQKRGWITYSTAAVAEGDSDATLEAFRSALRKNTALVICTHASNVTGVQLPIGRIGAMCRLYGIPFAVDGAQTAGVLPIALEEDSIDYLCAPGHKGLYGPMGTGILVTKKGADLQTILEGGTGTASIEYGQPIEMPEHLEPGTQNLPGICGLRAGIQFLEQKERARIFQHEMQWTQALYDALKKRKGVTLYSKEPELHSHVPVLSFNLGDLSSEAVGQQLNQRQIAVRAGLHCAPAAHQKLGTRERGTVRVCPSAFTTERELYQLLQAIQDILNKS